MSCQALQYIFKVLLPSDLEEKQILDVGSRLGAVLYGVSTNTTYYSYWFFTYTYKMKNILKLIYSFAGLLFIKCGNYHWCRNESGML